MKEDRIGRGEGREFYGLLLRDRVGICEFVFWAEKIRLQIRVMSTFRLVEKIGEGSYSKVYKATSETSARILAIKIISFKDAPKEYIQSRQMKILRECRHPNIASLLDFMTTEKAVYLVFQYLPMNLSQYYRYYRKIYNRNLDRNQIRNIMVQICSALDYLHSKGIMHRDVKPENVMINPVTQEIKLIDFGFAKNIQEQRNTGYIVTRWYRPLEIVIGLNYNQQADVFGVAAIFLELVHGREIFQSQSNMEQMYMLLNVCGYPSPGSLQYETLKKLNISPVNSNLTLKSLLIHLDDETKGIISLALSNESAKRPPISKLLDFFRQTPINASVNRNERESMIEPRRRARSTANGLTLVSLAYSSREKSGQKEERESLTKDSKKGEMGSSKGPNRRFFKVGQ